MSDTRDRLDIEVRRVAELEKELAEVEQSFEKYGEVAVKTQHRLEADKAACEEALRQAEYAHVTRLEICDDLRHKLATAKESLREALSALSHARMFIEYARYELEPGLATIGDQFPRQEDADKEIKNIDAAIEKLKRTEGM